MNNWKLRSTITGQNGMDFVEVNGHLASLDSGEDTLVQIVPFGDKYPYFFENVGERRLWPRVKPSARHLQRHIHAHRGG